MREVTERALDAKLVGVLQENYSEIDFIFDAHRTAIQAFSYLDNKKFDLASARPSIWKIGGIIIAEEKFLKNFSKR